MTNPSTYTFRQSAEARLRQLGPLRVALFLACFISILIIPTPGTNVITSDWRIVSTLLVPVLTPLTLMLLFLDALMNRVFLVDAKGLEYGRYRFIVATDLAVAAIVVLITLPYYLALGD